MNGKCDGEMKFRWEMVMFVSDTLPIIQFAFISYVTEVTNRHESYILTLLFNFHAELIPAVRFSVH